MLAFHLKYEVDVSTGLSLLKVDWPISIKLIFLSVVSGFCQSRIITRLIICGIGCSVTVHCKENGRATEMDEEGAPSARCS